MKKAYESFTTFIKYTLWRWLLFGLVIYISLFFTLKFDTVSDQLDRETILHICQTSPIFKPPCSCGRPDPFQIPLYVQESQTSKKVSANPNEKHHVAFVKTHKAASSTVLNILYRFARERDLVVLLPKDGNYLHGRHLNKTFILPPPMGRTYDILCNHAFFNHTSFSQFLPSDTVYIGIVREPFRRFISAFHYFRYIHPKKYLKSVPGGNAQILRNYLMSPWSYEPKDPMNSVTNNRMAIDFGFSPEYFHNEAAFNEYLVQLNRTMSVVMVSERFDESLVLVKRLLHWDMKDILYTVKNRGRVKAREGSLIDKLKKNYEDLSKLDRKLYAFFVKRLETQIAQQGPEFHDEVKQFKAVRQQVTEFCTKNGLKLQITVPKTRWTDGFRITRRDCVFLKLEEIQFLLHIKSLHVTSLRQHGVNANFWASLPG